MQERSERNDRARAAAGGLARGEGGGEGAGKGILRVIVTADNHLSAYTPKLSPQRLAERRQRLRRVFSRVVDEALARRAHLFIQAGDLFDSTDPRNLEREFVAAQLVRLRDAGIRAFAVSGNHDTPRQRTEHGGYSPQGIYAELGGLHYFPEAHCLRPVSVEAGGVRAAVAGLSSNPGAAPGGDPLDGVELDDPEGALAGADLGILILHAAIEGHGFPGETESIVRRSSLEGLEGFGTVLAGHVHAYARFRVAGTSVVVCGPTERMEFGESEGAPGFAYLEIDRSGVRHAEHVPIPPQPRRVVTVRTAELWPPPPAADASGRGAAPGADVADAPSSPAPGGPAADVATSAPGDLDGADATRAPGPPPSETPTEVIEARLGPACTPDAMVRLRLEGPVTREQYRALDLRRIWLFGQRAAFSFEVDESALFLATEGGQGRVASAGRVAPHDVLEQVAREWLERADARGERALLAKTRERVLARYAEMTGREAER